MNFKLQIMRKFYFVFLCTFLIHPSFGQEKLNSSKTVPPKVIATKAAKSSTDTTVGRQYFKKQSKDLYTLDTALLNRVNKLDREVMQIQSRKPGESRLLVSVITFLFGVAFTILWSWFKDRQTYFRTVRRWSAHFQAIIPALEAQIESNTEVITSLEDQNVDPKPIYLQAMLKGESFSKLDGGELFKYLQEKDDSNAVARYSGILQLIAGMSTIHESIELVRDEFREDFSEMAVRLRACTLDLQEQVLRIVVANADEPRGEEVLPLINDLVRIMREQTVNNPTPTPRASMVAEFYRPLHQNFQSLRRQFDTKDAERSSLEAINLASGLTPRREQCADNLRAANTHLEGYIDQLENINELIIWQNIYWLR